MKMGTERMDAEETVGARIAHPRYPDKLAPWMEGAQWHRDEIGRSGDAVLRVVRDEKAVYVKASRRAEAWRERDALRYLAGKLPVPELIAEVEEEGCLWLVMSEIAGENAIAPARLAEPERTVRLLAEGLNMFWMMPTDSCPYTDCFADMLNIARERLSQQNRAQWSGPDGFDSPERQLAWLEDHCPPDLREMRVLSHGDYCLPNLILDGDSVSGFVDLGGFGVANFHLDLMRCLRSMTYNFGTDAYEGLLLKELNVEVDRELLRYCDLLDELL